MGASPQQKAMEAARESVEAHRLNRKNYIEILVVMLSLIKKEQKVSLEG
jgi:hypothetical protein